ncbi:hypothetical protein [Flavobacterium sp. ZB4R12]|uniref:ApeA N-terminal domain 1-containing protein n=1 Tax=Flavobacterium sp. ZB4R12 TaxID=3398732 RepID=UPI003AAB2622
MFDKSKYYGEIWLPENENTKHFCVLEFIDGEVYLETNLASKNSEYKRDLLYGAFNGLGFMTFINNSIKSSSSGLIFHRKYNPEYTFASSNHIINPLTLRIKEFKIDNDALNNWIRSFHLFNYDDNNIEKADDVNHKIKIVEKSIQVEIIKTTNYASDLSSFNFINLGFISFVSESKLTILECIELYRTFQKFLLFYYGKSSHFKSILIKCLSCGNWFSLYFNDSLTHDDTMSFTSLAYEDVKDDLDKILNIWFTNEDIRFCADIIIENLLSKKVSHSRRFTNSLATLEAYNKRFGIKYSKPTLERYFLEHKGILLNIMNIEDADLDNYIKKIIRSRDFFVHGNKNQTDYFTEFELLYISFLIDYIVCIELSKQIGFSQKIINDILMKAKSVFLDMQSVNKMLSNCILKN